MASALLALATAALVLVVLYPAAAVSGALLAGTGWYIVRVFRRFYRTRRQLGRTRTGCVPKTGVCLNL